MEPQCYSHLNIVFRFFTTNSYNLRLNKKQNNKAELFKPYTTTSVLKESLGLLVLLGCDITAYTPVAYLGHRL